MRTLLFNARVWIWREEGDTSTQPLYHDWVVLNSETGVVMCG